MKSVFLNRGIAKCTLSILFLFFLVSNIKAQGYVYYTYDDFLHQKYTRGDASNFMFYKNYPDELIETTWKNQDVWGYIWNNSLYVQADVKGAISGVHVFKVLAVGEYVLYSCYVPTFTEGVCLPVYYISKSLNSQLYRVDRKHLNKLTQKDPVFAKLEQYMKKAPESETLLDYIKNSKEYKPLSELMPKPGK